MNNNNSSVFKDYLSGKILDDLLEEKLDDAIDEWHDQSSSEKSLYSSLGMTAKQYEIFATDPMLFFKHAKRLKKDYYKMNTDKSTYIPSKKMVVTEAEGACALREAWKRIYHAYPSDESLAILWAKTCLETGRFKVGFWNYNFGNIKYKKDDDLYTMFECGEEVSLEVAEQMVKEDPIFVSIVRRYTWSNGSKRASIKILPGHEWSKFRAYHTIEDGAEDYIRFLSEKTRYKKAWEKLMEGDPEGYSYALGEAGYYTADPKKYTAGVVRLYNEFMQKKDELLASYNDKVDQFLNSDECKDIQNKNDLDSVISNIEEADVIEPDILNRVITNNNLDEDQIPTRPINPKPESKPISPIKPGMLEFIVDTYNSSTKTRVAIGVAIATIASSFLWLCQGF